MRTDYLGNKLNVGDFVYFIGSGRNSSHGRYQQCICQLTELEENEYPKADVYGYAWAHGQEQLKKFLSNSKVKTETMIKIHVDESIQKELMKADSDWEKNN